MEHRSETRDGVRIDWNMPITMDDGLILRADVYRPISDGQYPVILTYGPYAKGLAFQDGYPNQWQRMIAEHPDVAAGSTNKYQSWEVVDPEKWVPDGYACARVDSRGCGCSPGYTDHFSPRETRDFYNCIEWAGTQHWSNGKVGLNGISYYAINQWHVASLQPPHLAAMCIWEGAADWYRDMTHHGGILCTFWANWYDMQVKTVQYGLGERGPRSRVTGELVCGVETLSEEELARNRCDLGNAILAHPLDDDYHKARSPVWSKITVPFLSAGNWGGQGLHLRGNVEGFVRAASRQKWLELHGLEHWTHFYTDYGRNLQKRFFDYFLKGIDNGWAEEPRVRLQIRHIDRCVERMEHEWPIARTTWTKLYLDPADRSLSGTPVGAEGLIEFDAMGDGVTFMSPPFENETEITGSSAAKLFVSSSTEDADIFLVLRVFSPERLSQKSVHGSTSSPRTDDSAPKFNHVAVRPELVEGRTADSDTVSGRNEVVFQGAIDPHTPISQGWLRASHRKVDPEVSTAYRPYHTLDEKQPLAPGEIVELDVEIWPTSIVIPAGYRIGLTVRGKDYEYSGPSGGRIASFKNELKGCGPFLHDDPRDRPREIFGGKTALHLGADREAYLLLPIIPAAAP
jgi:predicted acyl esterase